MQARREPLAQTVHRSDDRRGGGDRVSAWRQVETDGHGRVAVVASLDILVLGAEIHPGDITHAPERAVRVRAQDDVPELLWRREPPLSLDVQLELLVLPDRARADAADRRLHVLRLDRADEVRRRQLQIVKALGVEPDAHRIVERTEDARLPDPGHSREHVDDVDDRVVGNKERILLTVLAVEGPELQDRRRFLLNCEALQLYLLRQL